MRVHLDFAESVAKDPERPDLNEDAHSQSLNGNIFSLSDGASESYDSKSWAHLLVNKFIENNNFNYTWASEAQAAYQSTVDFQSLSWSKQLAFDRGSFATLLGITLSDEYCNVLSIGDCLAVLIRENKCVASFPFNHPEQFDARPQLLSTITNLNSFAQDEVFEVDEHTTRWQLEKNDVILLMTDAVGQWFLREVDCENNSIQQLMALSTSDEFESLIVLLREERRIKLDDSTVLRFVVTDGNVSDGISNN